MRNDMKKSVAVVIPAFEVATQIRYVLSNIGKEVDYIIVVDDNCPGRSGEIAAKFKDKRIHVIYHDKNYGVGEAVKTGYVKALELGADIIVKVDGDGQMDPTRIPELIQPILNNEADYTKGNRFFEVEAVKRMPKVRIFGNLFLSFMTKLSTGYWHIFDPNNGFTAITSKTLSKLPLHKIDSRYFFESDMLFRLYLSGIVTKDVSIPAIYGDEKSNLKIRKVLFEFPAKHLRNFLKRIFYSYYLKQFNLASIELPLGIGLGIAGLVRGSTALSLSNQTGQPTPAGTVVLTAILLLSAVQFILAFLNFDMTNEPKK